MIKNKCPDKYHCNFTCKNCIYDDLKHFRELFKQTGNPIKTSSVGPISDFTKNLIALGEKNISPGIL